MDQGQVLLELFVIFASAKVAGEIFRRLNQPPVIGELLVGVALGSHALGLITDSEVHHVFRDLGAIALMFMVGLDTRLEDLRRVGRRAASVGLAGIVLPFLGGLALLPLLDGDTNRGLFLGAALVATSVGITARVLSDLGVIDAIESRIVLGAAVVDDVLGLLVLAVVTGAATGNLSPLGIAVLAVSALGFVGLVGLFGARAVDAAAPRLERTRTPRGPFVAALGLCLGLSALAESIGLAAIIGAFLAGMALADARPGWDLERQFQPVYELLVPFFFVLTGAEVDLGVFQEDSTAMLAVVVTAVAIATKLVACGGAAAGLGRKGALRVGVGMVPRGEVGIIVAGVGLGAGVIGARIYGVVVAMSVLTTLITPPVLRWLFAGVAGTPAASADGRTDRVEGIGG